MKGMSKEGLSGWERGEAGVDYPFEYQPLVHLWRCLRGSALHGGADPLRNLVNEHMRLRLELEQAKRLASEGKGAQPWEEFIRPFAAMDAEQLADWITQFKTSVAGAKRQQQENARLSRGHV